MAREIITTTNISDLCTDEIDLKLIEDVHALLGTEDTQKLVDKANAANDDVDMDLEKLIRHLDFYLGKAERHLAAAGFDLEWTDSEYIIFRENA